MLAGFIENLFDEAYIKYGCRVNDADEYGEPEIKQLADMEEFFPEREYAVRSNGKKLVDDYDVALNLGGEDGAHFGRKISRSDESAFAFSNDGSST